MVKGKKITRKQILEGVLANNEANLHKGRT